MLKRIHIRGYKSFKDVEVTLSPLVVLVGPNAAGKSNLLDALQLLSRLGTSRTLREAFDPPCRGKPLESFTFGSKGIKGLLEQDRPSFSIEVDLSLSDAVVDSVNRQIREMRRQARAPAQVRERDLRYRIEVEMLPRSGILRVADEYLAVLNRKGQPTGRRKPFLERQGERIHLRHGGHPHPACFDRYLDHSILSIPHSPPHYPHLVAVRQELESWQFFYFEPRERMRSANPVREVRQIGLMGEELAAFLNTMRATDPGRFRGVEKALHVLMPDIDGIEVEVSGLGEVELRLREDGVAIPARILSEGTLRMLGLLALSGVDQGPALVGIEEPENGVHPRQIELIAELLRTQECLNQTQHIITTHSPILPDLLEDESLFAIRRLNGQTRIDRMVPQPRHSKEEFARLGQEIYEQRVRPQVEKGNRGRIVAIDIETGEFEVGDDPLAAADQLFARCPDAQPWLIRIGHRALHSVSGTPRLPGLELSKAAGDRGCHLRLDHCMQGTFLFSPYSTTRPRSCHSQ